MFTRSLLLIVLSFLFVSPTFAAPLDNLDTLKFSGGPLYLGQSRPVYLEFESDEAINALWGCYRFASAPESPGWAQFDSIVFIDRMADPQVLNMRLLFTNRTDGISPDTLPWYFLSAGGALLAPGAGKLLAIYYTGLNEGFADFSHAWFPDHGGIYVPKPDGGSRGKSYIFPSYRVAVVPPPPRPTLAAATSLVREDVGSIISFPVSYTFPSGSQSGSLTYREFKSDAPNQTPQSPPTLSQTNPAIFSWVPGSSDIGIWTARFIAADNNGQQDSVDVNLQVVASADQLIDFSLAAPTDGMTYTGLMHGDFDADDDAELAVIGMGPVPENSLEIYDVGDGLDRIQARDVDVMRCAPALGYVNNDDYLDIASKRFYGEWSAAALLGGPGANFTEVIGAPSPAYAHSSALGEFTGDANLDFVSYDFTGIALHPGAGDGSFGNAEVTTAQSQPKSIAVADFDRNGLDDLALGTMAGIETYLRLAPDHFTRVASYAQPFGSADVEVSNDGSDLNGDGHFDLCVATPSIGGTQSQMILYFGNGDGTFRQQTIITVFGQILANCIADINGDALMDIVYVNGARRYVGILYGDGQGSFASELRYAIPAYTPSLLDCFDVDLDGDVDIVVAASGLFFDNAYFLLENGLDPVGLTAGNFEVFAHDQVTVAVFGQSQRMISDVCNSMPAAAIHKRDLDADAALDRYIDIDVVESGEYTIEVQPRVPETPSTFTLECRLNGQLYRLADNALCTDAGLQFGFFTQGAPIAPIPGSFVGRNIPTFRWPDAGNCRLQLATDPNFENLILNTTVSGGSFAYSDALGGSDTVTYYWRVCANGGKFDKLYSFNVVSTITAAEDDDAVVPEVFSVEQNHPNPFNPATMISYTLAKTDAVKVEIFNTLGQTVATLIDEMQTAGQHAVEWRGVDATGRAVPSGVYFYRVTAGANQAVRKMVLLK